jgi:RHS repeat-associated protein
MDTGSGGTVANVFDQAGRLTVANPGADKERTYTYDAVGNLTSVNSPNVPWYNRVYTYDALNRLEHAEGPYGIINYTYDGVGNRLTKEVNSQIESYTYATGTNKIQEITGPIAYTYDANGNITDIGNRTLIYNQNNRLIQVEEDSAILGEYTYNGEGQRVIKTADAVTTVFHYDFNGNLIAESDETGNFVYEYLYKGGSRLALVDVVRGEIYSFLNDRLGTPQMLADSTNTIVWEGIYKPFGDADVNPNSSVVNNFRFAGQYYDEETGFHYNYHRYYDPNTGRYLTPDPIGLLGGINLWTYSGLNPINAIDPFGLDTAEWGASGTIAAIGAAVDFTLTVARDTKGDVGLVLSFSKGGYSEVLGGSIHGIRGTTDAKSINNLRGSSAKVGIGGGGRGISGAYEHVISSEYSGNYIEAGFGESVVPVDMYGMQTSSYVINFNDLVEALFNAIFRTPLPDDNLYGCEIQ